MDYQLNTRLNGNIAMTSSYHERASLQRDKTLYKFIWVQSGTLTLEIDHIPMRLEKDEIVTLTPLHHLEVKEVDGEYLTFVKGKFFGLEFTDGTIVVRVLDSVEAYYDEGNALHHCVGQCEYYLKPNTLVFSARIENKRVETVELSLETFKVLQSRGLCNKNTKYHKRIMNLVHKNIALVRKRMTA